MWMPLQPHCDLYFQTRDLCIFLFYVDNCYQDNHERILDPELHELVNNTPEECDNLCSNLGFLFYGVQYSYQCFCGNDLPSDDLKISMSECYADCSGDSSQKCGGTWAMNIGQTSKGQS